MVGYTNFKGRPMWRTWIFKRLQYVRPFAKSQTKLTMFTKKFVHLLTKFGGLACAFPSKVRTTITTVGRSGWTCRKWCFTTDGWKVQFLLTFVHPFKTSRSIQFFPRQGWFKTQTYVQLFTLQNSTLCGALVTCIVASS